MKVLFATILALATATHGMPNIRQASATTTSQRELQNNYNYGNGQGGGNYQYENFEQYMQAQMAKKSFTFTGCSSTTSQYGYTSVYATFRLCDSCSSGNSNGCGNENGDYIVNMREFGETFGEYWEQTTYQDKDTAPFSCVRAEEYAENFYQNQYQNGYNNGQQQQQQQQYNQYNGQQQQQQNYYNGQEVEYFVGPLCDGGSDLKMGVFYDEYCSAQAQGVSLKQALGFTPDSSKMKAPKCVPCASSNNNYNNNNNGGNGEQELNPLCDRMLEQSGRCDRTGESKTTEFDSFWKDVVQWFNEGGYNDYYDDGNEADYAEEGNYNNQNQQNNYNNYNGNQNQYNYNNGNRDLQNNNYMMNYNQYQNQNTCDLIDSLPHTSSAFFSSGGMSAGRIFLIIGGILAACAVVYGFFMYKNDITSGRILSGGGAKRDALLMKRAEAGGGTGDYHREGAVMT